MASWRSDPLVRAGGGLWRWRRRIGGQHPRADAIPHADPAAHSDSDPDSHPHSNPDRRVPDQRIQPLLRRAAAWRGDGMVAGLQWQRRYHWHRRHRDRQRQSRIRRPHPPIQRRCRGRSGRRSGKRPRHQCRHGGCRRARWHRRAGHRLQCHHCDVPRRYARQLRHQGYRGEGQRLQVQRCEHRRRSGPGGGGRGQGHQPVAGRFRPQFHSARGGRPRHGGRRGDHRLCRERRGFDRNRCRPEQSRPLCRRIAGRGKRQRHHRGIGEQGRGVLRVQQQGRNRGQLVPLGAGRAGLLRLRERRR